MERGTMPAYDQKCREMLKVKPEQVLAMGKRNFLSVNPEAGRGLGKRANGLKRQHEKRWRAW